jgi:hypothetical protein
MRLNVKKGREKKGVIKNVQSEKFKKKNQTKENEKCISYNQRMTKEG